MRWTRSKSLETLVFAAAAVLVAVWLEAWRCPVWVHCFHSAHSRLVALCLGSRKVRVAYLGQIPAATRESQSFYLAVALASKSSRVSLEQHWISRGRMIVCLTLPSQSIGRRKDRAYDCSSRRLLLTPKREPRSNSISTFCAETLFLPETGLVCSWLKTCQPRKRCTCKRGRG